MFYKVIRNIESANTKPVPPKGNTGLGFRKPLVTDQYIILFYVKLYGNIYYLFANTELMANCTITHAWTKLIYHMNFPLLRHTTAFLHIRTLENISLGCHFNSRITRKCKKKKKRKKTLNRSQKGHFNVQSES